MSGDGPESPHTWPRGQAIPEKERIETRCAGCGALWWIQARLAGHRLRCDCGAWIDVPAALVKRDPPQPPSTAGDARVILKATDYSSPPASNQPLVEVPTSRPMAPDSLRHAPYRTRRRWTNRGVLEMVGIVLAFWLPPLFLRLWAPGPAVLVYLPLSSLASGLLILLLGLTAPHYTFGKLRHALPKRYLEGALVGIGMAFLAFAWSGIIEPGGGAGDNLFQALRDQLGLAWVLILVGGFPALFEEVAFRGLLQGRLSALHGRNGGILYSGIAFAFAHGMTIGLPFHVFGGFYLGWLRARSDSLFPGMLVHLLYNAAIVFLVSS